MTCSAYSGLSHLCVLHQLITLKLIGFIALWFRFSRVNVCGFWFAYNGLFSH